MHARYIFFILLAFIAMSFSFTAKPITIYMIGDSTMSIKASRAYPETGWGMPFAGFFDSTVKVDNRAKKRQKDILRQISTKKILPVL